MKTTKTDKFLSVTFLKLLPSWVAPNHITIFRFLTIPFVLLLLVTEEYVWGIALFAISAFSDALDGALARTKNQVTDWGKLFDPLADKMLICVTAVFLITKHISAFVALGIILIEILLIVVAYYKKRFKSIVVQAHWTGKIKMWLQSLGMGALFVFSIFPSLNLFVVLAQCAFYSAIILALVSLLVYKSV
jgi:CDP-diacylglycerol--glycerol-3-phosphate 3-phosphatidyltransferase